MSSTVAWYCDTRQICLDKVAGTKFSRKNKNEVKVLSKTVAACYLFVVPKFMAVKKGFPENRGWTLLVSPYIDILVVEPVVWIRSAIWLHSSPHYPVIPYSRPQTPPSPSHSEKHNICLRTGGCSLVPSHEEKRSGEPSRVSWASARSCDSVT